MNEAIERRHTRRSFLQFGLATIAMITFGGCANHDESSLPPSVDIHYEVATGTGSLDDYLPPSLIERFELQELTKTRSLVHGLKSGQDKPTYIHLFDTSVDLNLEALKSLYAIYNPANIGRFIETLKRGRDPRSEYQVIPDSSLAVFRYDYSPLVESSLGVKIYAGGQFTKQRHILFLSNQNNPPEWSKIAGAVTRGHVLPAFDNNFIDSIIFITVINTDMIKQEAVRWEDVAEFHLNRALGTEICQQTIIPIAVKGGKEIKDAYSAEAGIVQEGVCNSIGYQVALRGQGVEWKEAERYYRNVIIGVRQGDIRLFQISKSAYNLMDAGKPPITTKSNY